MVDSGPHLVVITIPSTIWSYFLPNPFLNDVTLTEKANCFGMVSTVADNWPVSLIWRADGVFDPSFITIEKVSLQVLSADGLIKLNSCCYLVPVSRTSNSKVLTSSLLMSSATHPAMISNVPSTSAVLSF